MAPGIYLNLNKRSVSVTFGVRGAHVTVGQDHVRRTVGLPGMGLSFTETTGLPARHPTAPNSQPPPPLPPFRETAARMALWLFLTGAVIILFTLFKG